MPRDLRVITSAALVAVLVACGGEPAAQAPAPVPMVDRSAAERPAGTLVEVSFDGGNAALGTLIGRLPPDALRAGLPSRVGPLLEGLIDTPNEIASRVDAASPLRLVMARIDGEVHAAVAVRLEEPLPESARDAGHGPRGSDRVGPHAAVDDRIAVVSDDPAMLDLAYGYLAYTALAHRGTEGAIVVSVPASTLATTVRMGLEQAVADQRANLLASIAAARAAHDRPPELGDPEGLIMFVSDAILARVAYLPDLGDAIVSLAPTPSGLGLSMQAPVTPGSPLATALGARSPVATALVSAMPTSAALVIATGTTAAARAASHGELAEMLAAIGGTRVTATERTALEQASSAISAIPGDEGALAIGASEANGLYALALTRGGTDAAAPTPWGRAFPWASELLGALAGCRTTTPRPSPTGATLCGDAALATRVGEGARADAIGRDAASLAETAQIALVQHGPAASPDLARDLTALPASSFAILLARPLRALPLMVALGGPPRAGLPRGDGAAVLAFAHDEGHLRIELRASTAAMADLDVVVGLFADETDSE